MSSNETENCEKTKEKSTKKTKFAIKKIKHIKKYEQKEVFSYIEKLHDLLKKHQGKIKKYKEKIKKLVKQVEHLKVGQDKLNIDAKATAVPAEKCTVEKETEVKEDAEEQKTTPQLSLVDEIRQAAEQAQNLNGFVYEPTSGLYYDQKTGYYYNAEYGLYYDGNTGCYYKYIQEKNEFEFHSQVQVTEAAATKSADNDIFDNYTVIADDNNEEWGVTSERPKGRKHYSTSKTATSAKTQRKTHRQKHSHEHKQHSRHRRLRQRSASKTDSSEAAAESKKRNKKADEDVEDGELESSSSSSSGSSRGGSCSAGSSYYAASDAEQDAVNIFNKGSRFQDIAKKYPPSLRIIVQESQLEELKVGNLSLITFKGGTLGREGKHDVLIPDLNVSKFHLKFTYDTKKYTYKCIDLGSRNGTILNGTRMSASKVESDPHDLVHGSLLQLGQTKLLCHVHEGNSTCGRCEPGLLITEASKEPAMPAAAVVLTHKEQLKKLQKKYGLENEKFVDNKQVVGNNYKDRAATRRTQVGSSTDKEKTQTASVNTAISSENKGFKMLSKLGWSKGKALGKTTASSGLLEPINVSSNAGKKGLGCADNTVGVATLTMADKKKFATWKKTQERYQKADNIFFDSDDEASS